MIGREKVERWLAETGVKVQPVDFEAAPEGGLAWSLAFQGGPFVTVVAHGNVAWNDLQLQVSVGISPEHTELLRGLDRDMRDRFFFDLRIALLQQQVGYRFTFEDQEHPETLTRIDFVLRAYEEDLSKAGFLRRNHRLQNTALLAVQMFQKLARFQQW